MKYLLYPISWLFSIIVYIRNALYDYGVLQGIDSKLPIISVGNIQVGGTGKTPFVIALSEQLINHGIKPLIITRGYKRNTSHQIILNNLHKYEAVNVGDEPYYIKQVLESVPIIIDHNKKNAVKKANQLENINCIILDDGFQSRYINKDIDIVLTSFAQIINFSFMPFGVFREPITSLKRADFIYDTKNNNIKDGLIVEKLKLIAYKNSALDTNVKNDRPFIAFSGIANPDYFIESLKKLNIKIEKELRFENHAQYNQEKYQQLEATLIEGLNANINNLTFITTYKDFVKLDEGFKNKHTIYVLEYCFLLNDNKLLNKIKDLIHEN